MLAALSPSPSVAERCRRGLEHGHSHRYGKEGGVRELGKKCTKGALRRCDHMAASRLIEHGEICTTVARVVVMVFLSTSYVDLRALKAEGSSALVH